MEINHPELTPNKRVPLPTPSISQKVFPRYPGITVLNKCSQTFSSAEPAVTIKEITGKANKITIVSVNKFQLPDIFREDIIITLGIYYCCLEEVLPGDTSNTKISSATWKGIEVGPFSDSNEMVRITFVFSTTLCLLPGII